MKLLFPLLPALALVCSGLAAAQDCLSVAQAAIPSCAQKCILKAAPAIGCQGTDFSCQCAQSAALFAGIEGCVATACPAASYQAVIDGSSAVCDCASPAILAGRAATVTVSGIGPGGTVVTVGTVPAGTATAPAPNSASASATVTTAPASRSTFSSGLGSVAPGGGTTSPGNANSWTGYTSVSNVATASVIGAAAQATPAVNVVRLAVQAVVIGAAML